MEQNQKIINKVAGQIIGKQERPQRNSWFDEECHIILEDKKEMFNRNTRQHEHEYKDKRKEAHKVFRQKREYYLNQSWSKWKLLIITMKQGNFIKE
jgi:hypothetical protein